MTHKKFFKILDNLYGFGKKGKNAFGVKYYCQAQTFSFHFFKKGDAYHGKAVFDSDTYSFWFQDKKVRQEIIDDIDVKMFELCLNAIDLTAIINNLELLNSNKSQH